jgi:hypothetical protein
MRRNLLHITLALFTFSIGFLSSSTSEDFALALLVGLTLFVLLKKITGLKITSHHLKVALLTLLIWAPIVSIVLYSAPPTTPNCIVDIPAQDTVTFAAQSYTEPRLTFNYI